MRWFATTLLLAGCNAVFGIHELEPGDPCTGVCECKVDADCGAPHTACIDQVTSRTCGCLAGYAMGPSGCTWIGVVNDPNFDQISDKWSLSGMAMRDATTTEGSGRQDPGQIVLLADDTCANVGQVSQTIRMPRLSRAEPLVVRATYAAGIGSSGFRPLIGIGSGWEDSPQLAP